jgi:hypothetical protein
VDILYLLDRLEEVIASARRLPFSSRVMIDEQECLDVVDQIRLALPEELKLARRVMSERDQILTEAGERADQLIDRAEQQIAHRVEDHAVYQAAQDRARDLIDEAQRESLRVRQETDEYAYGVFESLLKRLRKAESVVQESLQDLDQSRNVRER